MKVAICDDSEQDIADLKEKLLKIIEGQIENCEMEKTAPHRSRHC